MAFFNRNKTDQAGMPTEVQDYYQQEGRERSWVAWLMAVATLLVTIFVVLGLFYGGRWAFRTLKNDDKPAPVAVQTDESKSEDVKDQPSTDTTPTPTVTGPSSSTNSGTGSTTTPNSTPSPSSSATTPAQSNAVAKGDLPDTGPGDALAVFVAVSVLGYLAHRRFLAKA